MVNKGIWSIETALKMRFSNWNSGPISRLALAVATMAGFLPAVALADLTLLNTWGSQGSGPGQFNGPTGLAIGSDGTVYVTDNGNYRVQYFTSTGTFQGSFGGQGRNPGQFTDMEGIAVSSSGLLYVADYVNTCVNVFSSSGVFQTSLATPGYGLGQFDGPYGVAIGPTGNIYVSQLANNCVDIFNDQNVFQGTFGSAGSGPGQFDYLELGIAVSSANEVYAVDNGNNRVQIFGAEGSYINSIPCVGGGGVAVGATGLVYVPNIESGQINVFNSAGILQSSFGALSTQGIAVAPTGMVYIAESYNDTVVRLFDPNSWVSGINTFTDATVGPTTVTVGPGQLMGASITLTSAMGLVAGIAVSIGPGGSLTQAGGSMSTPELLLTGAGASYVYQGGPLSVNQIVSGGSISVQANATLGAVTGDGSLTIGTTTTPASLQLNAGPSTVSSLTINPGSTLDIESSATAGELGGNGSLTIGATASLQLVSNGGHATISSLTINPGGVFDITNNKLVINYAEGADPVATIRRYLKSAYNGGIWTGPGLTSSTVQSQVAGAIAHGGGVWSIGYLDLSVDTVDPAATQLFIEPALVGDANLDGSVTFIDLGIVAQNLGGINTDWEHGDFNFDGTTNFLDIGLLAQNLSKTILNTPLGEMIPDPSAALTAQWNLAVAEIQANSTQPTNLPEPGVIGLLAVGATGLLTRRRSRPVIQSPSL